MDIQKDPSPIPHLLRRVGQIADEMFGAGEITPRQYAVMRAVAEQPGAHQILISRATGIDRSTLSEVLRRLQRAGLITIRRDRYEMRRWCSHLTEKGRVQLEKAESRARAVGASLLEELGARTVASLEGFVQRHAGVKKAPQRNGRQREAAP
ncbi:MAG: MarR family winged helix-turn-helix transcriptional regulator [Bacteroidota bacterium]